jgi:hypothetical protein
MGWPKFSNFYAGAGCIRHYFWKTMTKNHIYVLTCVIPSLRT